MTQDLTKLKKDLESNPKSLQSKITDLKSKIAKLGRYKGHTILVDTSGSMSVLIGDKSAIQIVGEVLENFSGATLYEFNSSCNRVNKINLTPRGGTNLGGAFSHIKSDGIKEITLITDGEPDSEKYALAQSKDLKINIIYIGPDPVPAFLKVLAQETSGEFVNIAMIEASESSKELENKIRLMLNS